MFVINVTRDKKDEYVQITLDMAEFINLANQYNLCGTDDLKKREQLAHELRSHKQALLSDLYDPMFIINYFRLLNRARSNSKCNILFICENVSWKKNTSTSHSVIGR